MAYKTKMRVIICSCGVMIAVADGVSVVDAIQRDGETHGKHARHTQKSVTRTVVIADEDGLVGSVVVTVEGGVVQDIECPDYVTVEYRMPRLRGRYDYVDDDDDNDGNEIWGRG